VTPQQLIIAGDRGHERRQLPPEAPARRQRPALGAPQHLRRHVKELPGEPQREDSVVTRGERPGVGLAQGHDREVARTELGLPAVFQAHGAGAGKLADHQVLRLAQSGDVLGGPPYRVLAGDQLDQRGRHLVQVVAADPAGECGGVSD